MRAPCWGAQLLARVGLLLVLTAIALLIVASAALVSPFVAAPATGILGLGVLLVVLAAFYKDAKVRVRLPGWAAWLGFSNRDPTPDETPEGSVKPAAIAEPEQLLVSRGR